MLLIPLSNTLNPSAVPRKHVFAGLSTLAVLIEFQTAQSLEATPAHGRL